MGTPEPTPEGAEKTQGWSRIAERGTLLGMRITVWCYRLLGRRACLALVWCVVSYFYLTDRAGRRATRRFTERVARHPQGRAALPGPPNWRDDFRRYQAFGVSVIDRIAIWSGDTEPFDFEVHGVELVDRLAEEGQGALVLGAHLGSFDALRLLAERVKTTVNVMMYTQHAQQINRIFRELSPDADARVIAVDPGSVQSVFEARACLERGEVVAILGDRVEPGDRGRTTAVPVLGDPVDLPQAPFLLAHLLGCTVFLMLALRVDGGRYEVFTEKLTDPVRLRRSEREKHVQELVSAYAGRLEHYALMAPDQWFNFFDYWGDDERRP